MENKGNDEFLQLTEGSTVYRLSGEKGTFQGYFDKDGRTFGQFKFEDHSALFPIDILSKRIVLSPPTIEKPPSIQERIKTLIDNPDNYTLPSFQMTEEQKKQITEIMKKAKEMGCVFRGDRRHPLKPDRDEPDIFIPPFEDGFKIDVLTEGQGIHTTTDYFTASRYPENESLTEKFLYIIRAGSIYETAKAIENENQFVSGNIPKTEVFAAIGHNPNTNTVTEVLFNQNFKDAE